MRGKVVLPVIFSILILGSAGILQQSYAQEVRSTNNADSNPPVYEDDDCHVAYEYIEPPLGPELFDGGDCTAGSLIADPPTENCEVIFEGVEAATFGETCTFFVPNFDDPFDTKLMRIQVAYDAIQPPLVQSVVPSVGECFLQQRIDPSPGLFFEDWICFPNPLSETVIIHLLDGGDIFTDVIIDTVSFNARIGGTFEGVNTTSLLVSGAQMNAAWLIPVIVSGIGFAIVIARKF